MAESGATTAEGDEPREPAADNSLSRLLALSDGVFAIAMTLLALDLRLPDLGEHVSDAQLRHALGDQGNSYLSFVISFYVVAGYWIVHRRAMRGVTTLHPGLVGRTLLVLFLVAALPFPASVLGQYGGHPPALVLYSAFNVAANLALLRLLGGIRAHQLGAAGGLAEERERLWGDIVVFVLCIAGAYVLGDNAPWLLLLLTVSGRMPQLRRARVAAHDR
jgi:uncharacterized membrane protein